MSAERKINHERYNFESAAELIEDFIMKTEEPGLITAWVKAQLVIRAQAQFYMLDEYEEEIALAMAWEDFDIACRAKGEPVITGAVFQLWSRLPKKMDKEFKAVLNRALLEAQVRTDPRLFRYPERARLSRIQMLEDGFDEAEATAMDFRPLREWVDKKEAEKNEKATAAKAPAGKLKVVETPVLSVMPGKPDDDDDIF